MKKTFFLIALTVFGLNACQSSPANQTSAGNSPTNASASNSSAANGSAANKTAAKVSSDPTNANYVTKLDQQLAEAKKLAAESDVKQAKYHSGTGVITAIKKDTGEIEIDHQEIKSLNMPAMKMMFHLKNKGNLEGFKVGDKIDFTIEDDQGKETIVNIYKK